MTNVGVEVACAPGPVPQCCRFIETENRKQNHAFAHFYKSDEKNTYAYFYPGLYAQF